ncbi:MAG TPA: hypothetical protein VIL58_01025 [Thermoplasmata archaeon]
MRELLFLSIAALGSWLFLNHQLLYLDGFQPSAVPVTAFLLATVVIYTFLRAITLVASIRPPAVRDGVAVCPECGQPLEDGTPTGVFAPDAEVHHPSPRPVRAPPATALGANLVRPVPTSRGADLDLSAFDDLFSDVENEAGSIDDLRTLPDRRDPFRSEPARRTHPGPSRDITGDRLSKSLSKKP